MAILNPCTSGLLNCTDVLGGLIISTTTHVSGDLFVTFLGIAVLLTAIALMFGLRPEYSATLLLPLMLGFMVATKEFFAIGAAILIYLAMVLTFNFILK